MNFPPPRGTSQGRAGRLSLQPQRSAFQAAWFRVGCRGAAALPVAASLVRERLSRISFRTPFGGAGCDEKASWCGCRLPRARVGDRCLPLPAALPVAARLWWPSAPGEAIARAVRPGAAGRTPNRHSPREDARQADTATGRMTRPVSFAISDTPSSCSDLLGVAEGELAQGAADDRSLQAAAALVGHAGDTQAPGALLRGEAGGMPGSSAAASCALGRARAPGGRPRHGRQRWSWRPATPRACA